jgi:hypothetical protein
VLVGAGAALAPVLAYFAHAGAWEEFYDCTVGHNLSYSQRMPVSRYLPTFWRTFQGVLASTWPVYLLAAVGLVRDVRCRVAGSPAEPGALIPAGWLGFSFLGVAAGGIFREHYFVQIAPAVALLAARGAAAIASRSPTQRAPGLLPGLLVGLTIVYGVFAAPWYELGASPDEKCRALYEYNPFPESPEVARFTAEHSDPNDSIFVFGSEPQIYYYADRRCASRYIFVYPLMTAFPDARDRQLAVLQELRTHRPRFIVHVFADRSFAKAAGSPEDLLEELPKLLEASYRVVAKVPVTSGAPMPLVRGPALARVQNARPLLVIWERAEGARGP